jgi:uncharacterized membrane protein
MDPSRGRLVADAARLAAGPPRPALRAHLGLLLAGWGIFNVVEGLIDHEILGIHHVRDDLGGPIGWDLGFLAFGALLILVGAAMVRSGERMVAEDRRPTR